MSSIKISIRQFPSEPREDFYTFRDFRQKETWYRWPWKPPEPITVQWHASPWLLHVCHIGNAGLRAVSTPSGCNWAPCFFCLVLSWRCHRGKDVTFTQLWTPFFHPVALACADTQGLFVCIQWELQSIWFVLCQCFINAYIPQRWSNINSLPMRSKPSTSQQQSWSV